MAVGDDADTLYVWAFSGAEVQVIHAPPQQDWPVQGRSDDLKDIWELCRDMDFPASSFMWWDDDDDKRYCEKNNIVW